MGLDLLQGLHRLIRDGTHKILLILVESAVLAVEQFFHE